MADTIIIAEDDAGIRGMLSCYFLSVGWSVRDYESGELMFEGEEGKALPDLYILDIMLPGMDGTEILRRLRSGPAAAEVPVIFLTARGAEMERVSGLESGADDYVVKPFSMVELQARVKAVLRRTKRSAAQTVRLGELEVDLSAHEVRRDGRNVGLTHKEFELLRLFLSRRGEVLGRDEIFAAIWGYGYTGETRTLDVHIRTLRQKLGEDVIVTVRGVGYKLL